MTTATETKTMYRASYTNHGAGVTATTKWYATPKAAQDALMKNKNVGWFHYLGAVAGDAHEAQGENKGWCLYAPRNDGAVDLDIRRD
jgi:hypothetical protein